MSVVTLDLIGDNQINIGATYRLQVQLCNAPDLTLYTGFCQIRQSIGSTEIALTPTITILSKDIFEILIPHTDFVSSLQPGNYLYDVMFDKSTLPADRFYAIAGKAQLVKRITAIA